MNKLHVESFENNLLNLVPIHPANEWLFPAIVDRYLLHFTYSSICPTSIKSPKIRATNPEKNMIPHTSTRPYIKQTIAEMYENAEKYMENVEIKPLILRYL